MSRSGSADMSAAAMLELVLRAAGLPVITSGADAEALAADAARTKARIPFVSLDDVTATVGLQDRRGGADSCRVR